ncbi:arabinan endo-1,5-alpha-L-arabinosidase [Amphiplicatus metriothermophilus]|uniref:Extracellular exo-alpha-(1->5)-L-arabinofuranosidase n=1 Tax=Amphiplicatus metriothermophilus TaxID=1519374 RepID=A0A239PZS1_9PROT|nr:arabinan endo-1,5-alpha-L-arabinosidase [Amphiplicatus metriothermophilus]MBB5519800.1 arabinan endo-1,5-alpha-L-arabinosidase [Amphiplicatus metriothermophilus]SNT75167.1 arabinan endo-1,5-alpha-L-arabinosidase [Amphiplicatus metriothermophilus]
MTGCWLIAAFALTVVAASSVAGDEPAQSSGILQTPGLALAGDLQPVHDPAIIKHQNRYHLFSTSHVGEEPGLVHWRVSDDLRTWRRGGAVFDSIPAWALDYALDARGVWAPDIIHASGEYRLYYSVSSFGKNASAIGLAANATLDPSDERFGWIDRGLVFFSREGDDFNAIDPNLLIDAEGRHWLSFGSFWTGLKMIAIDPESGLPAEKQPTLHSLARRPSPGAVEAPFIIERGGYYYLFASFDFCCRGAASTYYTVVGRASSPTGPYVDRDGVGMMAGGGSVVLHAGQDPTERFFGPGHVAILRDGGADYIVHHAYDARRGGAPTLRIRKLEWTQDGWPRAR